MMTSTHDTDPSDLIQFATDFASLGSSVTEQILRVVNGEATPDTVNPAAVSLALDRLAKHSDELAKILRKYLAKCDAEYLEEARREQAEKDGAQ